MSQSDYKKTKIGDRELHPETQMMSYGYDPFMSEGAVKPPVFLTSTFAFESAEHGEEFFHMVAGRKPSPEGEKAGLVYSRFNHPNMEIVEDRLALYEKTESCAVFASGMGAISTTFLAFLRPGDVILHSQPLYGGTETLITKLLPQFGIHTVGFFDDTEGKNFKESLNIAAKLGNVRMVYLETPANPTNAMIDFKGIGETLDAFEAETGQARPITACDNTLLGPVFQNPCDHGIDLAIYSLTKYIGGHSDLVGGSVCGRNELLKPLKLTRSAFGMQLDPHSCWMISRSLETLGISMNRAAESGLKVGEWLRDNSYQSVDIMHPDLIDEPHYKAVYKRQCTGPGSTFAFSIGDFKDDQGGDNTRKTAFKLINALGLFKSAVSLGGTESLICHPASTTHSGVDKDEREKVGVNDGLIRLSIGLEHPDDLIADLDQAFKSVFG
jgi:methionine-gamma-lyase